MNFAAFDILQSDVLNGLVYAAQSIKFTYDRMDEKDNDEARFAHIRDGIIMEQASERALLEYYKINLISSPFRTSYRDADSSEFVLMTKNKSMIRVDLKGFHIFKKYRNDIRSPASVYDRGLALVPDDQFSKADKDIYIFVFMLADTVDSRQISASSQFSYHNSAKICSGIPSNLCAYSQPVTAGIAVFGREKATDKRSNEENSDPKKLNKEEQPKTRIARFSKPQINAERTYISAVDCVFGFNDRLRESDIYIKDVESRCFIVERTGWSSPKFHVADCELYMAGWATAEDIKQWQLVQKGTQVYPYPATKTTNRAARFADLRPMDDLQKWLGGQ